MSQTRHIGLIFRHSLTVYRDNMRGIRDYSLENPHWVLVPILPESKDISSPRALECDGLICHLFNKTVAQAVTKLNKPVVNISGTVTGLGFPRVTVDHVRVGQMAAEHLLERGFRRFGFVGYQHYEFSLQREEGFCETIQKYQTKVWRYLESQTFQRAPSGFEACSDSLRRWIHKVEKPIAVFTAHDVQGFQVSEACREAGIQIPEEIALISVDNDDLLCALCRPSLSSIELPTRRVGYEAAVLLNSLMKGRKPPKKPVVLPPTRVMARESSDLAMVPSQDVSQALQFIREHFVRPIRSADVLAKVPVSRRALERNFRRFVGRSIGEEIRRARLNLAEQLLIETELAVGQIAERTGFTEAKYLSTEFHRSKGVTPSKFRKQHRIYPRLK